MHRSLGCVGTITDGSIRDLDEMTNAGKNDYLRQNSWRLSLCTRTGFKALAQRLSVGHANAWPLHWNKEVEVDVPPR